MNKELILRNLEAVRESTESEDGFEVCSRLLALAGAVIRQEGTAKDVALDDKALRMLYGQYVKVGNGLLDLFSSLEQRYNPQEDERKLKEGLSGIQDKLLSACKEYGQVEAANRELLQKEKDLRTKKNELEELTTKIPELIHLRDKELAALQQKKEQLEESLSDLNSACESAKEVVERYQAEVGENGRLIRMLPEQYGTTKNVDDLIAQIKKEEEAVEYRRIPFEEMLEKLLCEIRNSYEAVKS